MTFVFSFAFDFNGGALGSYNPAFGLAVTTYYVGLVNTDKNVGNALTPFPPPNDHGHGWYASCIWVYIIFPFVGALVGVIIFKSLMKKKAGEWISIKLNP